MLTWFWSYIHPEGQLIKTNQQNILIRSLLLKKQKGESSSKGTPEDGPKKRYPLLLAFPLASLILLKVLELLLFFSSLLLATVVVCSSFTFFVYHRAANKALDERSSAKRPATVSRQGLLLSDFVLKSSQVTWLFFLNKVYFLCTEGSSSRSGENDLQSLTVEKLRALLKEKGLPTKGRKASSIHM